MTIAQFVTSTLLQSQENPLKSFFATLLSVPLVYIVVNEIVRHKSRFPLLKSPPGLPLIGHIWDIRDNAAQKYTEWAEKYGDVYQIQLGNIPVVIVNSAAAAKEIFGRNSQALASRPEFYTFHKIISNTAGTTIGTSPYSESLKRRRKGAASALNRPSVVTYVPLLDLESRDFIRELYEQGDGGRVAIDPMPMVQRLSLSLGVTLNWGVRIRSQQDHLFEEITYVEEQLSKFRSTTSNLQDYIPILRLNPFSGQSAKAREMRNRRDAYLKELNDGLDERMMNGTYKPCIQANVILDREAKLSKEELTSISLTMLGGGLDTVTTALAWFCCMLSQRPDIQKKAIAELRKSYNEDQPLCDAEDDEKNEYIVALIKELLRYYCVLRLNLPRASIRDISFRGTKIPKGTIWFINAWACNYDPAVWDDPEVFRPERWFEQLDAPHIFFGIGYRMCPGYLLAQRELYMVFTRMLSSFEIRQFDKVDSHPVTGCPDLSSLVAMPPRYKCLFVPRNEKALQAALAQENKEGITI